MREIGFEQFLDRLRRVFGLEVVLDLLANVGIGPNPPPANRW